MKFDKMFQFATKLQVSSFDKVMIGLSIVVTCFQGVLIFQSKSVRETHPMGLIMGLSFVQMAYFWDISMSDAACDLKLP